MYKFGVMDNYAQWDAKKLLTNVTTEASVQMARYLSTQSHVLIKNQDNLLPLPKKLTKKVAVLGLGDSSNCLVHSGGSGSVVPSYIVSPLEGLRAAWGLPPPPPVTSNCSTGHFLVGFDYDNQVQQSAKPASSAADCCNMCAANPNCVAFSWTHNQPGSTCYMKGATTKLTKNSGVTAGICHKPPPGPPSLLSYADGKDLEKAAAVAKAADVSIVFVGTLSHEMADRASLSLDDGGPSNNQNALIDAVPAANPNTVVVMAIPGAILMPWAPKVKAIVTNFMPGQQAGHAIADVLTGAVNPSGKLPLTFPNKENEQDFAWGGLSWPGYGESSTGQSPGYANYSEKLLVGYRYYDAHHIQFTTGAPCECSRAVRCDAVLCLPHACWYLCGG